MKSKVLDLYPDKSCFIIIGSQKFTNDSRNELKVFPLKLYRNIMNEMESEQYLGYIIHGEDVSESAAKMVNHRYGNTIHGIKDIKANI